MNIFEELQQAIIDGKAPVAKELTEKALGEGVKPAELFPKSIVPAMNEVGRRMRDCEYFIPEVLISARAARASTDILRPLLVDDAAAQSAGTVVCATVKGDLHDIGKNIVSILLRGAGYTVKDLGNDIDPQTILAAVKEEKPEFLGLSALLTSTMAHMEDTIKALSENGLREQVKVIIGGAPVSEEFARRIGADGYGADGFQAVAVVESLSAAR